MPERSLNSLRRLRRITLCSLVPFAVLTPAVAEESLGQVTFQTTCASDANDTFRRGLTLLHHMMYVQAEAVFNEGIQKDDTCAMLHWGVAMSNFHPLWPGGQSKDEVVRGTAAALRLKDASGVSDVEASLIMAARRFYDPENGGYRERIAAWAEEQAAAYKANPDDLDTAALFALAQLATAPRGDMTMARQSEVGDLLDTLHARDPDHPGVIHYAIHAYDNPPLAERGLPYAEIYDGIAPNVAHALHMPSHIFVRKGMWDETIDWNARSAEAALAQKHGDFVSGHYAHAMDYRIYAHLQKGETDVAQGLLEDLLAIQNYQSNFGVAYALAASPVRVLLETEKWSDAAALSDTMHPAIPWEKFPQAQSIRVFAKGIGAIRSGDQETASTALARLAELRRQLEERKIGYWATLTESQMLSIEAWRELGLGNTGLAIQLQTQAADLEDAVGKSPVTPGHVLPARELLGDLYAELGDTASARKAYDKTLASSPNRRRSLANTN